MNYLIYPWREETKRVMINLMLMPTRSIVRSWLYRTQRLLVPQIHTSILQDRHNIQRRLREAYEMVSSYINTLVAEDTKYFIRIAGEMTRVAIPLNSKVDECKSLQVTT